MIWLGNKWNLNLISNQLIRCQFHCTAALNTNATLAVCVNESKSLYISLYYETHDFCSEVHFPHSVINIKTHNKWVTILLYCCSETLNQHQLQLKIFMCSCWLEDIWVRRCLIYKQPWMQWSFMESVVIIGWFEVVWTGVRDVAGASTDIVQH